MGSSNFQTVSYYANLLLISSFLGLGIGTLLSGRQFRLLSWFPLLLLTEILMLLACRSLTPVAAGVELRFYASEESSPWFNYAVLTAVFVVNAILFLPIGQEIGNLFSRLPPLSAYSFDLLGSLAGSVCFGAFSFICFSPTVGIAVVSVLVLFLLSAWRTRAVAAACFICSLVGVYFSTDSTAIWSPYYYITVRDDNGLPVSRPRPDVRTMMDPPWYNVQVNQDFYHGDGSLNPDRYSPLNPQAKESAFINVQYFLPYEIGTNRKNVLVLGSGGGTDVEAALLCNAERVDAVEIDPMVVEVSKQFSAAGVYLDPRVNIHVEDARAFIRRSRDKYGMVVFGFLDSQALFSSMTNVRLDGFTYTVEGIRSAFNLLTEDGLLTISFAVQQEWLGRKLIFMVAEATGRTPLVYVSGVQLIICASPRPLESIPAKFGRFSLYKPADIQDLTPIGTPTDDWPYLYLSQKSIPSDYLYIIVGLSIISVASVVIVRGRSIDLQDGHFFFLGFGFLLLETANIADCSLYFGATWLVTTIVVAGVLLMVLIGNALARYLRFSFWIYAVLLMALALVYLVPRDIVLGWSMPSCLAWTVFVLLSPIFFAGLIFSTTFRNAPFPALAFGANLMGASVGGFSEYLGMMIGHKQLILLAVAAYLLSCVFYWLTTMQLFQSSRRASPGKKNRATTVVHQA